PFKLSSRLNQSPRAAAPRAAPAVQAARPQPPVLSVRCGANRRHPALASPWRGACGPTPGAGNQRAGWQQGDRGWSAAGGGKGRLIFLYSRLKLLAFARDLLNSDYAGHRLTFALFAQSPPYAHLNAVYNNFDFSGPLRFVHRTAGLSERVSEP